MREATRVMLHRVLSQKKTLAFNLSIEARRNRLIGQPSIAEQQERQAIEANEIVEDLKQILNQEK